MKINIAIDGYAGCGKSTLAKDLALALGYRFIDTGALYRGVTLYLSRQLRIENLEASDLKSHLGSALHLSFNASNNHLLLNGEDAESEIRSSNVAQWVSKVAAFEEVRSFLFEVQQDLIGEKGVVMEGRDIGTVIMPDAEAKFFITANMEVRAQRRLGQIKESGKSSTLEEVARNLNERDRLDASRRVAPLKKANDAIAIDNSTLTREEQRDFLMTIIRPLTNSKLLPFV